MASGPATRRPKDVSPNGGENRNVEVGMRNADLRRQKGRRSG
jgi:hypothetical protein